MFLGLIPGWGGTQLVPQLVGAEQAVTFIVENPLRQNRMLDAQQAFEAGFADALLEPVEFLDESLAFLLDKVEEGAGKRRPAADLSDVAEVVPQGALASRRTRCTARRPRPTGRSTSSRAPRPGRSRRAIAPRRTRSPSSSPGPQAQASVYAFDLVERRAKRGVGMPAAEPRRVQRVGIVGAGLMARQLALLFLRRLEVPVVLRDLTQEQVDEAITWIAGRARRARPPRPPRRRQGALPRARSSREARGGSVSRAATSCSRRCSRRWP